MSLANPQQALLHAPIGELVVLLCKQFYRLLLERHITLTTHDMQALAQSVRPAQIVGTRDLHDALWAMVGESVQELEARFGLSFAQSLARSMDAIGGWETTAEFLELANHKSNAELRIASASSLLAFLGNAVGVAYLLAIVAADAGVEDVEAMIARRALCHVYAVDTHDGAWLDRVRFYWEASAEDKE